MTTLTYTRFWAKVAKTKSCWLWTAALKSSGAGVFSVPGRGLVSAHRLMYEIEVGPLPDGMLLVNTCGNKACVLPQHHNVCTETEVGAQRGIKARIAADVRFFRHVDITGFCWLWNKPLTRKGYALFRATPAESKVVAHRWAYEYLIGTIPAGLFLDHLCRVKHCVNPDHLEPVTNQENVIRGNKSRGTHRSDNTNNL